MSHHSPQDYDKFPTTDSLYNNSNHLFHSQQPSTYSTKLDKLQQFVYKWRWPIFLFILVLFSGILMWIYRREFFEALEVLSHKLKEMGFGGYVLISLLIFTSAFPPIFGYSAYQTLSGYTFGFSTGFPISYLSGLLGASVCFWLSRTCLKLRVTRLLSRYPNIEAAIHAVEKKGFKLFVLIRLSPYPFNLLNFLFGATSIPFTHFVAGTAISLTKIALHVYIGANLTSFAKHILGEDNDEDMTEGEIRAERLKYTTMILGSLISFGVMAYIYRLTKAAIAEANATEESEEMQGFLSHPREDEGEEQ
ncbi:hypothetical protein G6F46_010039 [Rhizopus delemar]|uniref:Golgi apparatus membrane protein TVP38 n=1 Tax=Rhizopus oryzae TaxID=64495 RepID=A0A9P6Y2L1_RHIOR|nr:hypothetical protein G6F55_009078 [Rhizopus delemar]KAG1537959.1 hypothetical protein G6F51_010053 [Rhizopus arrhizus]KAG1494193.1 hypothetical protein G6F54_008050 [Rhizopus delemar]KAG1501540.1 hypothetical protein G6F52_012450 [Rhizopus delemar]KAG1506323.1 hypothetical protein G6F53_009772 [Rhizopus delemar]